MQHEGVRKKQYVNKLQERATGRPRRRSRYLDQTGKSRNSKAASYVVSVQKILPRPIHPNACVMLSLTVDGTSFFPVIRVGV